MPAFLRKAQTTRVSTDSHKPLLPNETITYDTREAAPKFPPDGKRYYSHISANNNPQILKSKVSACGGNHSSVKSDLSNQIPHWKYHPETNSPRNTWHLRGAWSVWQGCGCGTVSSGEEKTVSLAGAHRFTALFSGRHVFTLFYLLLRVTTTDAMDAKHSKRPTSQRAISLKTTFFPANLKCFMWLTDFPNSKPSFRSIKTTYETKRQTWLRNIFTYEDTFSIQQWQLMWNTSSYAEIRAHLHIAVLKVQ